MGLLSIKVHLHSNNTYMLILIFNLQSFINMWYLLFGTMYGVFFQTRLDIKLDITQFDKKLRCFLLGQFQLIENKYQ